MEEKDYGSGFKSYSMTGDEALKFLDGLKGQTQARDFVNEGAKLFMQGNYSAAEAKFKEAIRQNPQNAVAHGNIGNIYFKKRQYEDAIAWLEKALAIDPNLDGAKDCLAECRAKILNPNNKVWWQFWK